MVMEIILEEDKDYKVCLNENTSEFVVYEKRQDVWEDLRSFKVIREAKEFRDKRKKAKETGKLNKKTPLNALKKSYQDDYTKTKITSIGEIRSWGSTVWWTGESRRRGKDSLSDFYKDTEKNHKIIQRIKELENEISELKSKREKFTEEEIKEYFGDEL